MRDTVSVEEALRFFGLTDVADLERLVLDHDVDAEIDDEGRLVAIDGADLREPLFEEHKRRVGHRPDDPDQVKKAQRNLLRRDREARAHRQTKRELLRARHSQT